MKRSLWTIGLVSILLLVASCGPSGGRPVADPSAGSQSVDSSDDVQRISVNEARRLVEAGEGLLLDTRSADSYNGQHAAGAVSFPEAEAAARVDELPTDKDLIFY